jgi:hypothetical protein
MKKFEIRKETRFSESKKEGLKAYFSLRTQDDTVLWFDGGGYSMLPLFWPGCRVRMNIRFERLEIGLVAVFSSGSKLIAHRLVGYDPTQNTWITKGDTLHFFDQPVEEGNILGIVDFIDQYGKHLWVGSDPAVARLSANLGHALENNLGWLPTICKKVFYFIVFIPCFVIVQIKKKFRPPLAKDL